MHQMKIRTIKKHDDFKRNHRAMVRSTGLEPVRSPTRPSNVRVCLFRHDRADIWYYNTIPEKVKPRSIKIEALTGFYQSI